MSATFQSIAVFLISQLLYFSLGAQCYDVIVAQDGSGDFTSIQAAIESSNGTDSEPFRIFVTNGVYEEKLFFERSFITIMGEDNEQTIITTAELRRQWRESNPDDWGAATVNIRNNVTDLTFANLTIQNNFAEVFPEYPDNHDHSFAIRGGGHKIILLNCRVTSTGGDTVSLWNTDGGMFYHNRCYFEGYVDYVAPRGYCYITDSQFYGHNSTASIWHDGSGGEDHKLVINNSHFDGVPGFALGRHHRDAQFYILNSTLSEHMQNKEIYWEARDEVQWDPDRKYYHNVHRPEFDWVWHRDNFHLNPDITEPDQINALWTFNNDWDPEAQLEGLLPLASQPSPANRSCSQTDTRLSWLAGRCSDKHLIYMGTNPDSMQFIESSDITMYQPGFLTSDQSYFWRIDEVTGGDTLTGENWQFQTQPEGQYLPNKVSQPFPADKDEYFTRLVRLDWTIDLCTTDSVCIYFGLDSSNLEYMGTELYPGFFISQGKSDSTYYWRVDSKNSNGITEGDIWSFTLNPTVTNINNSQRDQFQLSASPNPSGGVITLSYTLSETGQTTINLYDIQGKFLDTIVSQIQSPGNRKIDLDLTTYSGHVICRMLQNGRSQTILISAQ